MGAVQRQQTHHNRLTGERVLDLGVDKIDLIQFARLEVVDGVHRDVTGALQRRGRRAVLELLHQAGVFAEGAVAHLTDDIETVVPVSLSSRSFSTFWLKEPAMPLSAVSTR